MPDTKTSDMRHIQGKCMMSAFSLTSARFSKLWIPFVNDLFEEDLCKNSLISTFSVFFLIINHNSIVYIYFTHISALNTASDDVTD